MWAIKFISMADGRCALGQKKGETTKDYVSDTLLVWLGAKTGTDLGFPQAETE